MNEAYLMKVAWNIWNGSHDLWAKVLKGKYGNGRNELILKLRVAILQHGKVSAQFFSGSKREYLGRLEMALQLDFGKTVGLKMEGPSLQLQLALLTRICWNRV